MSLREMPDHFICDACAARQHVDLLCAVLARPDWLPCVRCCACESHRVDDIAGTVIFPWRGLDASEHRTRRHR